MVKRRITDSVIYRWRYILGYSVIALTLVALLILAGLYAPGGISENEMASTVKSAELDFSEIEKLPKNIVSDLPYHALQLGSINLLGVNTFSIKLPSLLIGALSAVGMIFLLRRWFRYNVAVLTAIIAITTGQFLYLSQSGTTGILYVFWSVWLLLSATMIGRQARPTRFWRYLFFILAALSLYTPLSIYVLLAIVSAVLLHPHLRYLFRKIAVSDIVGGAITGLIIISPLIYQIVMTPALGFYLLGIPSENVIIQQNLVTLISQYFDFTTSADDSGMMMPVFGLGSMLLILIGAYTLVKTRYSVKSYIVTSWILLLIPILIFNPSYAVITLVPLLLLLANGISILLRLWYSLFPKNPYARIAGLIPLGILISGLVISGIDRYFYGYQYDPDIVSHFSRDISLIEPELGKDASPTTLVVPKDYLSFYEVYEDKSDDKFAVTDNILKAETPKVIVSGDNSQSIPEGMQLSHIVTNERQDNADRFYVYKNLR